MIVIVIFSVNKKEKGLPCVDIVQSLCKSGYCLLEWLLHWREYSHFQFPKGLLCINAALYPRNAIFSPPFFFIAMFYLYRLFKSHFGASVVIGSSQKSYLFHESQDMTFMLCGSIKTLEHLKVWHLVLSCLSWSFVIFIGRLKTILNR